MDIAANLNLLNQKILASARKVNRDPDEITLIAVTKFASLAETNQAIQAGITAIGENRVRNAKEKFPYLDPGVTKHLIGSLQTNKVKAALELFDLVHSVDRPELVAELATQALKLQKPVRFLIQLNISGETSKHGLNPKDLPGLLLQIQAEPALIPCGLMTIAPLVDDPEYSRPVFRELKRLFVESANNFELGSEWKFLSMGMTQDYQVAVEEGANLLRIGTAIFKSE